MLKPTVIYTKLLYLTQRLYTQNCCIVPEDILNCCVSPEVPLKLLYLAQRYTELLCLALYTELLCLARSSNCCVSPEVPPCQNVRVVAKASKWMHGEASSYNSSTCDSQLVKLLIRQRVPPSRETTTHRQQGESST